MKRSSWRCGALTGQSTLIQKWHEDAEYGGGWPGSRHQIDAVNARVHELEFEQFSTSGGYIKEMDDRGGSREGWLRDPDRGAARPGIFEGETMSIKSILNLEIAIKRAEHLLLVLKRMKDDPQGHHTNIPCPQTRRKILFGRWQAVVGDFQSLVDVLNKELELEGTGIKFIFDTEEFADIEVEGLIQ